MTQFEFLITFASVVLAIGISELFSGWAKVIRSGAQIRWSGLWIGWSLYLVLITMMYWTGLWPYAEVEFTRGIQVVWLTVPTFFLIVLSYLFSPDPGESDQVNLDARYWQIAPKALPLIGVFLICASVADLVIMGEFNTPVEGQGLIWGFLFMVTVIGAFGTLFIRSKIYHWTLLVLACILPLSFLQQI